MPRKRVASRHHAQTMGRGARRVKANGPWLPMLAGSRLGPLFRGRRFRGMACNSVRSRFNHRWGPGENPTRRKPKKTMRCNDSTLEIAKDSIIRSKADARPDVRVRREVGAVANAGRETPNVRNPALSAGQAGAARRRSMGWKQRSVRVWSVRGGARIKKSPRRGSSSPTLNKRPE